MLFLQLRKYIISLYGLGVSGTVSSLSHKILSTKKGIVFYSLSYSSGVREAFSTSVVSGKFKRVQHNLSFCVISVFKAASLHYLIAHFLWILSLRAARLSGEVKYYVSSDRINNSILGGVPTLLLIVIFPCYCVWSQFMRLSDNSSSSWALNTCFVASQKNEAHQSYWTRWTKGLLFTLFFLLHLCAVKLSIN